MSLINLTNHRDHPNNPLFVVYFFARQQSADYFEQQLIRHNIFYERAIEDEGGGGRHLFGIRKTDQHLVEQLNYNALGKSREKFIPNRYFRWFVLAFTLGVILLAIIGAIKSGG